MTNRVSILSDSISTLDGVSPSNWMPFYSPAWMPREKTWWDQVITHLDGTLEKNSSFSGSTAASPSPDYALFPAGCSAPRLDLGNPDTIFIFLGTNDALNGIPLKGDRLDSFEGAYSYILQELKKNYPQAAIIALIPPKMPVMDEIIRSLCARYDVLPVSFDQGYDTMDGFHPTKAGMKQIAQRVIEVIKS